MPIGTKLSKILKKGFFSQELKKFPLKNASMNGKGKSIRSGVFFFHPPFLALLFFLVLMAAFFLVYFLATSHKKEPVLPKEKETEEKKEPEPGEGVCFDFNEKSGFLGWTRQYDILNVSNSSKGIGFTPAAKGRPFLGFDRPIFAGSISAIRITSTGGEPIFIWMPFDSKMEWNYYRLPDLFFEKDQFWTTYYFFVEEELSWKENLSVAFTFGKDSRETKPKDRRICIKSISFLSLSLEERRKLEGKEGERGRATIGVENREVIYASPPHHFETKISFPENPVLEFGYGVLNSCWNKPGDGVIFSVRLRDDSDKIHPLLQRELNPKKKREDQKWFDERIFLTEYAGKEAAILFKTKPGRNPLFDYAVWTPPQVFSLNQNPEDTNVLIVSFDTLRPDHLGCYGYHRPTSPTIDSLAKQGLLFEWAFSTASETLSSHMSLMTSLLPSVHQVLRMTDQLSPERTTLAERLRGKGYATVAFTEGGKVASKFGFDQGFKVYHDGMRMTVSNPDEKQIQYTFPAAADWIRKNSFKKFFMFLHTYETHMPYGPPPSFSRKFCGEYDGPLGNVFNYKMKQSFIDGDLHLSENDLAHVVDLYDGAILHADHHLAGVFDALRKEGIFNKTLIILLSDHGEDFFDHFDFADHDRFLYDEFIRVPLILKPPGPFTEGKRIYQLVSILDVVPTVLDVLGISLQGEFDGQSLLPLIRGKESRSTIYSMIKIDSYPEQRYALRTDGYKYIYTPNCERIPGRKKLLSHPRSARFRGLLKKEELFDVKKDPQECINIAEKNPELAVQFKEQIDRIIDNFKKKETVRKVGIQRELRERLKALGYIE